MYYEAGGSLIQLLASNGDHSMKKSYTTVINSSKRMRMHNNLIYAYRAVQKYITSPKNKAISFILPLLLFSTIPNTSNAQSSGGEEIKAVKDAVVGLCRGGDSEGSSKIVSVKGTGEVKTVVIKKLIELGGKGELKFSKKEWKGIEPMLSDPDRYVDCVIKVTPMFLDKFSSKKKDQNKY